MVDQAKKLDPKSDIIQGVTSFPAEILEKLQLPNSKSLKARLVYCNDYYMGIKISITKNTLSWNVISIIIH